MAIAMLEPTLTIWMMQTMCASEWQLGIYRVLRKYTLCRMCCYSLNIHKASSSLNMHTFNWPVCVEIIGNEVFIVFFILCPYIYIFSKYFNLF